MEPSPAKRILADWDRISRQTRRPGSAPRSQVTTGLPVSTITGAALLLVVVVAGGLWLGMPPSVDQPGAQASPSPVEPSASPVEPSVSPMEPSASPVEPSPSAVGTWGPLAVPVDGTGPDLALASGILRITEKCVFLEGGGGSEPAVLVWPPDRTRWVGEQKTVDFRNPDGTSFTLRDGDPVAFGGGGDSKAESGVSAEEWIRRHDWLSAPDLSCPLDVRWYVWETVVRR